MYMSNSICRARQAFRQAQLAAKENLEDAQRIERSLLLSSFVNTSSQPDDGPSFVPRHKPGPLTKEERELNASSDVTLALRRTHNLMQSELSRSQFAHDTLKESTAALGQLSEQYNTLDTMLAGTKNLLGTLLRSQKSDTWYLETAFMILAVTVGWLIFRRFLYGPAWWFIYLPLKLFYKAWMGVFVAVGLRSDRNGVFASNEAAVAGITIVGGAAQPVMAGTQLPTMSVNGMPRGTQSPGDGQGNEDSMIEEVGRIIDDAQQEKEETVEIHDDEAEKSRQGDSQRNPKKRMWEEGEDAKIWQKKDEL
jgi:protein transport protein SEC20